MGSTIINHKQEKKDKNKNPLERIYNCKFKFIISSLHFYSSFYMPIKMLKFESQLINYHFLVFNDEGPSFSDTSMIDEEEEKNSQSNKTTVMRENEKTSNLEIAFNKPKENTDNLQ